MKKRKDSVRHEMTSFTTPDDAHVFIVSLNTQDDKDTQLEKETYHGILRTFKFVDYL